MSSERRRHSDVGPFLAQHNSHVITSREFPSSRAENSDRFERDMAEDGEDDQGIGEEATDDTNWDTLFAKAPKQLETVSPVNVQKPSKTHRRHSDLDQLGPYMAHRQLPVPKATSPRPPRFAKDTSTDTANGSDAGSEDYVETDWDALFEKARLDASSPRRMHHTIATVSDVKKAKDAAKRAVSLWPDSVVSPAHTPSPPPRSPVVKPQLSTPQKKLLRTAWSHWSKTGVGSFGSVVFRKLFEKDKKIISMFGFEERHIEKIQYEEAFCIHAGGVIEILNAAFDHMDNIDADYLEYLHDFGRLHAKFHETKGLRSRHWDLLGEAIFDAAIDWEGAILHRDTIKALISLVAFVIGEIKNAFDDEVRLRRRRRSSEMSLSKTPSPNTPETPKSPRSPKSPNRRYSISVVRDFEEQPEPGEGDADAERDEAAE